MKNQKQNVWVGTETLKNDPAFLALAEKEFVDDVKDMQAADNSLEANRRDFLKILGFSLGAATSSSSL